MSISKNRATHTMAAFFSLTLYRPGRALMVKPKQSPKLLYRSNLCIPDGSHKPALNLKQKNIRAAMSAMRTKSKS